CARPGRDVVVAGDRLAAVLDDLVGDLLRGRLVGALALARTTQVVHDDVGALARQQQRLAPADPSTGARHDRDLPVQRTHLFPPRSGEDLTDSHVRYADRPTTLLWRNRPMPDAVIVSAARTAIGTARKGSLADVDVFELAKASIGEALKRSSVPAEDVDDIILGESLQGGGRVARYAAVVTPA